MKKSILLTLGLGQSLLAQPPLPGVDDGSIVLPIEPLHSLIVGMILILIYFYLKQKKYFIS